MIDRPNEFSAEEIQQRADENRERYQQSSQGYPEKVDCENTNLEEPEESFYW